MPENRAAQPAAPFLFFDDEDDGFGDFKFATSPPPPNRNSNNSQPQQQQEDDEWGEFVASPLGSRPSEPPTPSPNPPSIFDPFPDPIPAPPDAVAPPPASGSKAWERPRGALPLSIFGDEEAEVETDPLDHPNTVFGPGLSSPSSRVGKEGSRSGSRGDLNDIIINLYGPAPAGANGASPDLVRGDKDDLGWEFKDTFSPDAGVKKEEKVWVISGLEKKADANGHGIEVVSNRLGQSLEVTGQVRVGNIERDLSDIYIAHDGFTNGLDFGSVVVHNRCISETNQQTKNINNGHGLQSSLENGDRSDDENSWEFKDAFTEVEDVPGSLVHKKIPDNEAKEIMPTVKIQGNRNMQENNLGVLHMSSDCNGEKDTSVPFRDHNGPFCKPTTVGTGTKDFNFVGVALNDIMSNLYDDADQVYNVYPAQIPTENGSKSAELGPHSVVANDDSEFDEIHWEFQKASETTVSDQNSVLKLDQSFSCDLTQKTFLDLYCRLKEECLFLIVHHLDDLKKDHEVAAIYGEQAKIMEINEKIQAAYKKLQEAMISENAYKGKHTSRDVCVSQLLEVIKEPHFQALEQEYCLQERILSAEKDLNAAIELLQHIISVLQILGFASKEEQHAYIIAWSKIAQACAQELQHGAMIWAESLRANVRAQILSRGSLYFVALGEIYRVVEILRASLKLYKPWILSSQGDLSEVLTCLEKCNEAWITSGLEKALENISDTMNHEHEGSAKVLLESIRLIHDLDELSLGNHACSREKIVCKLSFLPMGVLQDMKTVVWNGQHYCVKLANLWANRISCDPPQLPHIHVS